MRALNRLFGGLLILVLLAGGAYGYVWYSAKNFLDQQIAALSSAAELTYQSLQVDPRGAVRVEGLQLLLNGYRSPIYMDALGLRASDPLFFLDPVGRLERGEYPEFLSIEVESLRLSSAADFLQALERTAAQNRSQMAPQLGALGCGEDLLAFTPQVWVGMGINEFDTDVVLTIRADNDRGTLDLFSESETAGVGAASADLSLSFAAGYLKPDTFAAANPRLKSLELSYRDMGYFAKRDRFCAQLSGVAEAEYRAQHLELAKQRAAVYSMQVPELLWQAYEDSNDKGADVRLGVNPVGGLGAEILLALDSPVQLIDRMRPHLEINGRPVDLANVDWSDVWPDPQTLLSAQPPTPSRVQTEPQSLVDAPESVQAQSSEQESGVGSVMAGGQNDSQQMIEFPGMAPKPEPAPPVKFRRTDFDDLKDYIYADIRIFTYYGNRVEGRLEAVEGDSIKILHRVGKGMAIYPVDRAKLDVIEVMR